MNKIDIVMTTWKREETTEKVIKCLRKNTTTPYRLIVIDNGSKFNFRNWLNYVADVYVKLDRNYGLEYAKNIGMNFVQSDLFISTDNDILVPKPEGSKDWLSRLIELMDNHPEFGAIALRPQVLVGTGDIFGKNPPEVLEFSHVPGYMRIMDSELVRKLGAWKDKRPLRGHEEYWISERIIKAGRKVGWASNIRCYHLFVDDNWGYGKLTPQQHGHDRKIPLPADDIKTIRKYFYDERTI